MDFRISGNYSSLSMSIISLVLYNGDSGSESEDEFKQPPWILECPGDREVCFASTDSWFNGRDLGPEDMDPLDTRAATSCLTVSSTLT